MLTLCPFCSRKTDGQLRCQQCQQRLTEWKNWDQYATEEHNAGVKAFHSGAWNDACNHFERATIFDPETPQRFLVYGQALTFAKRFDQAKLVLKEAHRRSNGAAEVEQAIKKLEAESAGQTESETATATANPLLCLAPILSGDENLAPEWKLALDIEAAWNSFAPFSNLVDMVNPDTATDAVHFLRAITLLTKDKAAEARDEFRESVTSTSNCLNGAVYLLHYSDEAAEYETALTELVNLLSPENIVAVVKVHLELLLKNDQDETAVRNAEIYRATAVESAAIENFPDVVWEEDDDDGSGVEVEAAESTTVESTQDSASVEASDENPETAESDSSESPEPKTEAGSAGEDDPEMEHVSASNKTEAELPPKTEADHDGDPAEPVDASTADEPPETI